MDLRPPSSARPSRPSPAGGPWPLACHRPQPPAVRIAVRVRADVRTLARVCAARASYGQRTDDRADALTALGLTERRRPRPPPSPRRLRAAEAPDPAPADSSSPTRNSSCKPSCSSHRTSPVDPRTRPTAPHRH
ncbi:hypothetical protein SCOCK_20176 [Actinacidiphila cocklensis]|uniref:Uncharacterized protein n=1 Tax=Actinacidiphila cocklensis TaxID=887465 RepID=A0A9W4DNF1_9ACTN|nr:hypothetical protein SCOCK_20176 [Actinacidiphila cocklensis]